MSPKLCLKCNTALIDPPTGRPRSYCSVACKRAAGYELTRINRRLSRLEDLALKVRLADWLEPRERRRQLKQIDAEIEQAELRLRLLLAGQQEGAASE
jgi:hypothetical protein